MLKDAREGFSADPKPIPNQKAIFPKHCTPKPAQKPLDASKKLPQAFQKPPKGVPEPPKGSPKAPKPPGKSLSRIWSKPEPEAP